MTLAVAFHPEAEAELRADAAWYDERQDGLGDRLEADVDRTIDAIHQWPQSGHRWDDWTEGPPVRSRHLKDFPYRLIYYIEDEELVIVAVAHEKRPPNYWRDRVTG